MTSKWSQISTKLIKFTYLLTILATIPPQSSQSTLKDQFTIVTGHCIYSRSQQNIYTCTLSDVVILNPTDVLEIVGLHLPGYTDADVQAVNHERSTIAFFNGEILRHFVNLRQIQIGDQGLREFGPNAFDVCPNLEELVIGLERQVTTFPSQMLRNCEKLQTFVAVLNDLMHIPGDLFGMTRNLVEFNVGSNQLMSIPENLLQNMTNLRIFSIGSNLISQISPNLLRNAVNLEEFLGSGNRFMDQQVIVNVLTGKTNLRRLWLSNNNFVFFDFRFFSQFQSLVDLSIGSNTGTRLTQISWQFLPSSLTTLRVDGIGEEIPGNAFNHLSNLNSLTLSGLGITSLHRDTFSTLSRLEFLSIQNTNLRNLHPDLFINQISLSNLNLNNNQIEELSAGIFSRLVNLGIRSNLHGIRIASNNIQRLNVNSFGQHPHMRHIDFLANRINEIERGIFSRFNQNLIYAGFRLNVCVSQTFFNPVNLDNDDRLTLCFNNWAGITTTTAITVPTTTISTTTTLAPTITTPGGCGSNYKKLEIFVIIFVGFLMIFW